ncbi:acylphosphatase [Desulfocurvus sp. DL9XJH121]
MIRSLQCVVTGNVQMVAFRAWISDQARSLGVKGWARNLADGTVEVLAQGDEAAVLELKKRLIAGSPLSKVQDVACKWIDYDKEHTEFQIRT